MKAKGPVPTSSYSMTKNVAIDTVESFLHIDAHPDPSRLDDMVYLTAWENALRSARYLRNWVADNHDTENE